MDFSEIQSHQQLSNRSSAGGGVRDSHVLPHIATARVTADYKSHAANCISLKEGSIVYVYNMDPSGWWDGMCNSRRGWFPSDFVTLLGTASPVIHSPEQVGVCDQQEGLSGQSDRSSTVLRPVTPPVPAKPPPNMPNDLHLIQGPHIMSQEPQSFKAESPELESPSSLSTAATLCASSNTGGTSPQTSPFGRSPHSQYTPGKESPGPTLPTGWRIKRSTCDGREFYVNTRTNFTTFERDEVFRLSALNGATLVIVKNFSELDTLQGPTPKPSREVSERIPEQAELTDAVKMASGGKSSTQGKSTLAVSSIANYINESSKNLANVQPNPNLQEINPTNGSPTYDYLLRTVVQPISDLNESTKLGKKSNYLRETNRLVWAVRDLLAACDSLSPKSSPQLQGNSQVLSSHQELMSAVAKLTLAAKIAASVWPPPDAVNKMRMQAGQVLSAVRQFVSSASRVIPETSLVTRSLVVASELSPFDVDGIDLSPIAQVEFAAKLDSINDSSLASAISSVQAAVASGSVSDLAQAIHVAVDVIGSLLSVVEEIEASIANSTTHTDFRSSMSMMMNETSQARDQLYDLANHLVSLARQAADPYSFSSVDVNTAILEECDIATSLVDNVVLGTKTMIDQIDAVLEKTMQEEADFFDNSQQQSRHPTTKERVTGDSETPCDTGGEGSIRCRTANHKRDLSVLHKESKSLTELLDTPVDSSKGGGTPTPPVGLAAVSQSKSTKVSSGTSSKESTLSRSKGAQLVATLTAQGERTAVPTSDEPGNNQPPSKTENLSNNAGISQSSEALTYDSFFGSEVQPTKGTKRGGKMAKFFGDNPLSGRLPNKPPFLGYNYRRDDISFNGDGQVLGGKFAALVERLTLHDTAVHPSYRDAFLMTFREFSSPQKLLQELKGRFLMEPPKVDTSNGLTLTADQVRLWNEKKLEPVRLLVINTFKTWLETYWLEEDNVCIEDMREFIESIHFDKYDGVRHLLLRFIKQKAILYDTPPPAILPTKLSEFNLLDLDPLEVARQITIMQMHTFSAIKPSEMLHQNWMRLGGETQSVNVRAFVKFSNQLSQWVVRAVLDPVDARIRARYLKFFIKLCVRLLELSNYNGVMAVRAALNAAPVARMKVTWELLAAKHKSAFEKIEKATDSSKNFAEYRTALRSLVPPALPFLGIALSDLTFAYEGNPDFRGPHENLINFDKFHRVADIINGLRRFQRPYNLRPVPEIATWIENRLSQGSDVPAQFFNNSMYEVSLDREPRNLQGASVREPHLRGSGNFGSLSKLFDPSKSLDSSGASTFRKIANA
ncbi:hypothetical protein HDU93_005240 [Gonapodya sp. JEL0774]|nr:hypothetical protein HDU93_005240 [Gonapodya sp. JEL0774]